MGLVTAHPTPLYPGSSRGRITPGSQVAEGRGRGWQRAIWRPRTDRWNGLVAGVPRPALALRRHRRAFGCAHVKSEAWSWFTSDRRPDLPVDTQRENESDKDRG